MRGWLHAIGLCAALLCAVHTAAAQSDLPAPDDPEPDSKPVRRSAPPPAAPEAPQPAPAEPTPATPAPAEPAPQPAPAEPQPAPAEPPPATPAPPPAPAPAPPMATPPPPPAEPIVPPGTYEGQVSAGEPEHAAEDYEPEPMEGGGGRRGFQIPPISIRIDPFNWLIEGRLGIELEVGIWQFISLELVPVFVVNTEPPAFDFSGRDDPISQHSDGLGPMSGTSIGAGFWLSGAPFSGYVARLVFTNYSYQYRATAGGRTFDSVDFTERRLMAYFGSHSRFGLFSIGGGIGLAYELNQVERCFPSGRGALVASGNCADDEQQILLEPIRENGRPIVTDLNGGLHPFYIEARFSLGLAFD